MTLDESRQISRDAGQCLVCAAHLSDPKSQADGIGPVCRRRFADWHAAVAAIRADLQLTDEEREHRRIAKARASVRAQLDGERIILTSDYDELIVSIIRTFEGSTWDDGSRRTSPYLPYHGAHWSIPREHATALAEAFAVAGIAHDDLAIIGMGLAS